MRKHLVTVSALGVLFSGLSVVQSPPLAVAVASDPDLESDVPVGEGRLLDGLSEPDDPAESIDGLTDELSDIPGDEVSEVAAEPVWTDVPDMPVEVRVPEDALAELPVDATDPADPTDPPSPTDSPSDAPSGQASDTPTIDPTDLPTDQATDTPTDVPTDSPTDAATDPAPGPEVEVSWDRPAEQPDVVLLSVEPAVELVDPLDAAVVGADVRIDYSSFDQAYGGGWADRYQVRAYPACYAVTPEAPECSESVVVPAVNDAEDDSLRFTTISAAELADAVGGIDLDVEGDADPDSDPDTDPDSDAGPGSEADPASDSAGAVGASDSVVGSSQAFSAVPAVSAVTAEEEEGSGGVVYAMTSAPGAYGAIPVSPSGEWQVGPGSGEFSYSYDFAVPPSVGGSAPDLALTYSSASVDGMTKSEAGQASPAGIGWNLEPGFISRSYRSCREDGYGTGSHLGDDKDDLCWRTTDGGEGDLVNELTLSLNGQVSRLVKVPDSDEWRLKSDVGWKVERVTYTGPTDPNQPSNGLADDGRGANESFKVTTLDGTEYWFGFGHGTESVWTVPVFANNSSEPCYAATTPAESFCAQAWRWNLDRVVDPSGNIIRYAYTKEINRYDAWGGAPVNYTRGGLLTAVEYGYRGAAAFKQRVRFESTPRCKPIIEDPEGTCSGSNPKDNPGDWPDVPGDLYCQTGQSCAASPSFFTTSRYSKVITEVKVGSSMETVDVYELRHTLPDPDAGGSQTSPADLWLDAIVRTGHTGADTKTLPSVSFTGDARPNQIVASGEQYEKFRVVSVRNETGGRVDVTYGHDTGKTCSWSWLHPDGVEKNRWDINRECFGQTRRDPANPNGPLETDWFHKYVVTKVAVGDDALGLRLNTDPNTPPVYLGKVGVYEYLYEGNPGWRFAGSPNTPTNLESWTDWRGYETTIVNTLPTEDSGVLATGNPLSIQRITRFRGLHDAPANPTQVNDDTIGRPPVQLNTIELTGTNEPYDYNYFEGLTAETTTYNRDVSKPITREYNNYASIVTINPVSDGEHPRTARMRIMTGQKIHTTKYNDSGAVNGTRTREIVYYYNQQSSDPPTLNILAGAVRWVLDKGDPADGDEVCVYTKYRSSTTRWIRVPSVSKTFDGACPSDMETSSDFEAQSTTDYDGGGSLTKGLPTATNTWLTPDGNPTNGVDLIHTEAVYDAWGRVTRTTGPGDDDHQLVTDTDYNPGGSDANPVTATTVTQNDVMATARATHYATSTKDIVTTTEFDPGRGLPTRVHDPNDGETFIAYNPLGQTSEVYLPGQGVSGDPSVRFSYTYFDPADPAAARVRTETLRDYDGTAPVYDDSYVFYDGWGRQVESQVPQPETPANQIVTSTGYDERGLVRYSVPETEPDANTGFDTVWDGDPSGLPRYTQASYDGAGRPIETQETLPVGFATTEAFFRGDYTVVQPPVGGVTVTEFDARDRPTRVRLHETSDPATTPEDSVEYVYTTRGELAMAKKTIDGVPYEWSYGYDMVGRQIWAHDPDTGVTTTEYDDAGNPVTVTTGLIAPKSEALDLTDKYHPIVNDTDLNDDDPADNPSITAITTSYDRLNRPLLKQDATEDDPADPNDNGDRVDITTWTYDEEGVDKSIGQLTTTTHPITGITPAIAEGDYMNYEAKVLEFDARGMPLRTSETYPGWMTDEDVDGEITREWETSYNEAGLPTQVVYPAVPGLPEATVDYSYTTGGRLRSMSLPGLDDDGDPMRIAHATYNNIGRTASLRSGTFTSTTSNTILNGLRRNYTFEAATGRFDVLAANVTPTVTSGTPTALTAFSLDYTYDAGGNPDWIKGTAKNPGAATADVGYWCYDYDGLNRLTRARTGTATSCANTDAAYTVTGDRYDVTYDHAADRLSSVTSNLPAHSSGGSEPEQLRVDYLTETANEDDERLRPHHNTETEHQDWFENLQPVLFWPDEMPVPGTIVNDWRGRIDSWTPTLHADLIGDEIIGDTGPTDSAFHYTYNNLGQLEHTQALAVPNLIPNLLSQSAWYAYGPDGTRFGRRTQLATGPETTTVYLGDGTEITKTTVQNKTESIRTFTTPGGTPIATQTNNTESAGAGGTNQDATWVWLAADAQNSVRLAYKHGTTGTNNNPVPSPNPTAPPGDIERPAYYPYGDPTSARPPNTANGAGYLNKPHDVTGDIRLDQRNYTPHLNTLTTPDPLLEVMDPQSFNPYSYARNNPIAASDPSGLRTADGSGSTYEEREYCTSWDTCVPPDDFERAYNEGNFEGDAEAEAYYQALQDSYRQLPSVHAVLDVVSASSIPVVSDVADATNAVLYATEGRWGEATLSAIGFISPVGAGALKIGGREAAHQIDELIDGADEVSNAANTGRTAARTCLRSFAGSTLVLMADGSKKPIEDVEVGDHVVATDPETGERVTRRVTILWVHDDTLAVLVLADGTVLRTTEDHLFWSVTDQRFERADELAAGEVVLGDRARQLTVVGFRPGTERTGLAYNLSIAGVHTYHVGTSEILVHNDCYSALDAINDPKALEGLAPSQIDDLARNAGFEVLPGKAGAVNPATRYYVPGTNRSQGFRVLPQGVPGQSGVKSGAYLKYFGGPLHGTRVPLGMP